MVNNNNPVKKNSIIPKFSFSDSRTVTCAKRADWDERSQTTAIV